MNDYIISLIRTVVPMIVGWAITTLAVIPAELSGQLEGILFLLISSAYYALARWLGDKYAWAGWLLGYNAEPVYETSDK